MQFGQVDYHIHTSFSDGEGDLQQIFNLAKERGLQRIAITDHFDRYDPNPAVNRITDEMLIEHFHRIRSLSSGYPFQVLCGVETCTDFNGNLRLSDKVLGLCDIVITSLHYVEYDEPLQPGNYYDERYWRKYMGKALNMAAGPGDVLGHCESYLPLREMLIPGTTTFRSRIEICRGISDAFFQDSYLNQLADALKMSGKSMELHCITQSPRENVIRHCAEKGVSFSIGSDAHALSAVGDTAWGSQMLEKYGGKLIFNNRT